MELPYPCGDFVPARPPPVPVEGSVQPPEQPAPALVVVASNPKILALGFLIGLALVLILTTLIRKRKQ